MKELSKTQISTIEKIASLLVNFRNHYFSEILELLDKNQLSKHKKILDSIYVDLKSKNKSQYARKFAKKYNL